MGFLQTLYCLGRGANELIEGGNFGDVGVEQRKKGQGRGEKGSGGGKG